MHAEEVERRLSHLRAIERRWGEDLFELDQHATYRLLAAGEMAGRTGAKTNSVMSEAPALWGWLGDLRTALDKVDRLRQDRGMFGGKNTSQIATVLEGPSVELRRSELPRTIPAHLQARLIETAPDADAVLVTLDTLIELFRAVYEPVRDVVAEVDAVWRDLMPRIHAAEVSVAKAEAVAKRIAMTVPEVRLARQRLDAVKSSVSDDPLVLASNVGDALDSLVADAAAAAEQLDRSYSNIESDADATSAILAELRVVRARAAAAYSEAEAKISPSTPLKRVPSTSVIDGPNGLAHRARQLADDTGAWQVRRRDLDRWHSTARRLRDQLTNALATNRKAIDDRNELRGLLRAYQAKAAMNPDLADDIVELGDEAHHELFTSPSDLDRARELIADYSAALSA